MSKYLFYTLGEILLVVIGILIALKINNWNENNKNRELEEQYYCRIHEDILQDQERIDQLLSYNSQRKSDANQLLRIILNEEYNTREILLQYIKTIRGSSINFEPNDATWEDLKSSGNLKLIKDIQIKKALNNYFKRLEPLINTNQVYIDYISNQYFKLTELSKQTGMVSVELATDEVGVAAFKFEKDIIEKLKEYEIDQIPEAYRDTFFNLAYNVAVNMERRTQLFGAIKEEVLVIEDVLGKKCLEVH
ncbi:MAG: hypothetical protein HKN68_05275 [Saprospiraceae bacterium]|nr:hypothetical protein [Saprospiraceae bacterium]